MANNDLNTVVGEVMPTLRIGKLTTLTGVTRFHQRVIKMVMRGEMPPEVGTKLSFMLKNQASMVEACQMIEDFAGRLEAMES